jgi:predicted transcriptional regulator
MPAEPTVQATFNLSPELHERLRSRARADERSMREVVEDALDLYLSEPQPASVVRSESVQGANPKKAKP